MADGARHVVFGTGPVGCWIARTLCEEGIGVRVVNRSGRRPGLLPDAAELVTADASVPAQARDAAAGAAVVYQALNPPYHQWAALFPALQGAVLGAAAAAGARYVSIENLYMFDGTTPMTETTPVHPVSRKGQLRRQMADAVMAAHARGDVQATALRSSDYYGPGVRLSALGDRVFPALLAGGRAQVLGSADQPHAFAYIEDVGRAAVTIGRSDDAMGRVWIAPHVPAVTQREMVAEAARVLAVEARLAVVPAWVMRLVGLFNPDARETVEMIYQFTAPFLVDSSAVERAFHLGATPLATGIARTVAWYRQAGPAPGA